MLQKCQYEQIIPRGTPPAGLCVTIKNSLIPFPSRPPVESKKHISPLSLKNRENSNLHPPVLLQLQQLHRCSKKYDCVSNNLHLYTVLFFNHVKFNYLTVQTIGDGIASLLVEGL